MLRLVWVLGKVRRSNNNSSNINNNVSSQPQTPTSAHHMLQSIGESVSGKGRYADKDLAPSPASSQHRTTAVAPPPRRGVETHAQVHSSGGQAKAVYDFSSGDSGDLSVQSGQVVNVVEKTSEDCESLYSNLSPSNPGPLVRSSLWRSVDLRKGCGILVYLY